MGMFNQPFNYAFVRFAMYSMYELKSLSAIVSSTLVPLIYVGTILFFVAIVLFILRLMKGKGLAPTASRRNLLIAIGASFITILCLSLDRDREVHPNPVFRIQREIFNSIFIDKKFTRGETSFADYFIGSAETYDRNYETPFGGSVFYRRTLAYKGPKKLDLNVHYSSPPNVIVLVMESWRTFDIGVYADKAKKEYPSYVSPTPNFDRLSKEGIIFTNCVSSFPTSRSIESIDYGMITYPGTNSLTFGTNSLTFEYPLTKLKGLPDMLEKKGYDTIFSSQARLDFDNWAVFLAGRYQQVWGPLFYKEYGHNHGIPVNELFWGVHDDTALQSLTEIVIEKHREVRWSLHHFHHLRY